MENTSSIPGPRSHWTLEPTHSPVLGPQIMADGVRFGVYSRHARRIHVALFREGQDDPVDVAAAAFLPQSCLSRLAFQLEPGWMYGFLCRKRPFDPRNGQRFNPKKFLLDHPCAIIARNLPQRGRGSLRGHSPGGEDADLILDHRPSHGFHAPVRAG